jgi:hypothetical protein
VGYAQQVGSILDVTDRDLPEQRLRVINPVVQRLSDLGVVVVAARDGPLKDARVGRHPGHGMLRDVLLQRAVGQRGPVDVVRPDALTEVLQLL